MNKLDKDYTNLLKDILENGVSKQDRTGTGTISVFGRQIRHKMSEGFPLLTTKKMYFKGIVTEALWFLRGDTNIKYLVDNDCHIWDGDAYKNYLKHNDEVDNYWIKKNPEIKSRWKPYSQEEFINKIKTDDEFAKKWGELGPVYGEQWRDWGKDFKQVSNETGDKVYHITTTGIDQIANLINDLKTNPDSRRLMVNAWNVGELEQMTLPPCHYSFQVYTRELRTPERMDWLNKMNNSDQRYRNVTMDELNVPTRAISLMWNQRSCDFPLGIPFNIASYGLLLEIIGKMVNMVPEELIGNLGDCHIYLNQIEGCKEQIGRELRIDERICMCYENPSLDLTKIHEDMSDDEFKIVCDVFNIPTRTREPFELPSLKIEKTDTFFQSLGCDLSLLTHLDISDFKLEGYQSHPIIKFPLSN
jgi:thymidylate synthase